MDVIIDSRKQLLNRDIHEAQQQTSFSQCIYTCALATALSIFLRLSLGRIHTIQKTYTFAAVFRKHSLLYSIISNSSIPVFHCSEIFTAPSMFWDLDKFT